MYNTAVTIMSIIINAWSWKKISWSMKGEALSCSVKCNHVVIFLMKVLKLYLWSLNPMHLSASLDLLVS